MQLERRGRVSQDTEQGRSPVDKKVTHAHREVEGQAYGTKVGGGEGQPRCRRKVLDIGPRPHHCRKRREEQGRAKRPPSWSMGQRHEGKDRGRPRQSGSPAGHPHRVTGRREAPAAVMRDPPPIRPCTTGSCSKTCLSARPRKRARPRANRMLWECPAVAPDSRWRSRQSKAMTPGGVGREGGVKGGEIGGPTTHRMTNLRGRVATMGNKAKHTTKQARAARLHPAKINKRSHRLTVNVRQPWSAFSAFRDVTVVKTKWVGTSCSCAELRHGVRERHMRPQPGLLQGNRNSGRKQQESGGPRLR